MARQYLPRSSRYCTAAGTVITFGMAFPKHNPAGWCFRTRSRCARQQFAPGHPRITQCKRSVKLDGFLLQTEESNFGVAELTHGHLERVLRLCLETRQGFSIKSGRPGRISIRQFSCPFALSRFAVPGYSTSPNASVSCQRNRRLASTTSPDYFRRGAVHKSCLDIHPSGPVRTKIRLLCAIELPTTSIDLKHLGNGVAHSVRDTFHPTLNLTTGICA